MKVTPGSHTAKKKCLEHHATNTLPDGNHRQNERNGNTSKIHQHANRPTDFPQASVGCGGGKKKIKIPAALFGTEKLVKLDASAESPEVFIICQVQLALC